MRIKMAVYVCGGCGNTVMMSQDDPRHIRDEDNCVEHLGSCAGTPVTLEQSRGPESCRGMIAFVGYTTLHSEPG